MAEMVMKEIPLMGDVMVHSIRGCHDILQVMSEQTDNLTTLLEPFGLTAEEAQVYLVLMEYGKLSALDISRKLHMGRTKVYRILDKLIGYELAINEYDEVGFKFVASPPEKLTLLIARQEGEVAALKQSLPEIQDKLTQLAGGGEPGSKVLYYRGMRGLSQVNWNLLETKGELLSYEVETADLYMPHEEAERLRLALVDQKIFIRSISNMTELKPFTAIKELMDYTQMRSIDPSVLTIKADVFIYNDVYALCHYLQDGDVFCVEMHNQELATMQKQLFENLWQQARPLENKTATA